MSWFSSAPYVERGVDPVSGRVIEDADSRAAGLAELRRQLAALRAGGEAAASPREDDKFLLAFLRAKKYDVPKALKCLVSFGKFWYSHPEIVEGLCAARVKDVWRLGMMGFLPSTRDVHGNTVTVLRMGAIDFGAPEFKAHYTARNMLSLSLYILLQMFEDEEMQLHGACYVETLEGFTFSNAMKLSGTMNSKDQQEVMAQVIPNSARPPARPPARFRPQQISYLRHKRPLVWPLPQSRHRYVPVAHPRYLRHPSTMVFFYLLGDREALPEGKADEAPAPARRRRRGAAQGRRPEGPAVRLWRRAALRPLGFPRRHGEAGACARRDWRLRRAHERRRPDRGEAQGGGGGGGGGAGDCRRRRQRMSARVREPGHALSNCAPSFIGVRPEDPFPCRQGTSDNSLGFVKLILQRTAGEKLTLSE